MHGYFPDAWLFCIVVFYILSTSQEFGWEEHLWNDLYRVKWDVKP